MATATQDKNEKVGKEQEHGELCGARFGHWSGKELAEGEVERRYGTVRV